MKTRAACTAATAWTRSLFSKKFCEIPLSMHCWQGDDIRGFEQVSAPSENVVTGNYPGAARSGDELRRDIETVFSMVPSASA